MKLFLPLLPLVMCSFFQPAFCNQESEVSPFFQFREEQVRDYHEKPSGSQEEIARIAESDFFANSKEVLDVGCGDGRLTAFFADKLPGISFIGCDVSQAMVHYASREYNFPNLSFLEKNAEDLGFENQFDTIVSFNCLHWIKNQKRALQQIFSALKPGGKALLIATPDSSNNDFKTACFNVILSFRWLPYFITFRSVHSFHTEQEYRKLLNNAGFLIEKIEIRKTELLFKDRNELDPFLKAILTPLQHLDPSYQPAFLEDFFQELNKQGRVDAEGVIHIFFDQIELLVSKSPSQ